MKNCEKFRCDCVRREPRASRQRGITLIEMMIAVALGLIVLAAMTSYFVQTSQNSTELQNNSAQIENGRYAIDVMREDLSLGGFYADVWQPALGTVWNTPPACTTAVGSIGWVASLLAPQLPVPIFGYPGGAGAPSCLANQKAGTDVLVVRRFNTEPTSLGAAAASQFYVQVSECATDPTNTPFAFGAGSSTGSFTLHKLNCTTLNDLWRYREQIYYVRTCSICGTDTIPTLVRLELDGGAMSTLPLVEGIEDFRVDFGVDTSGDGQPDQWRRCDASAPCAAADWANVTATQVYVLSRNLNTSRNYVDNKTYALGLSGSANGGAPFSDGYKRHVYSAQITMSNRAGPREPIL